MSSLVGKVTFSTVSAFFKSVPAAICAFRLFFAFSSAISGNNNKIQVNNEHTNDLVREPTSYRYSTGEDYNFFEEEGGGVESVLV